MSSQVIRFFIAASCLALFASCGGKRPDIRLATYERWDPEIVEMFNALPIQEGGRVKPMQAYAQVRLLRFHAKRSMKLNVGEPGEIEKVKITAGEWFLDVMFRPELARSFPTFIVNDSDAIVAIGMDEHSKRRSRYSYDEILPAREKLSELSAQYRDIEEKDRTGKQNQVVDLARNVSEFEFMNHAFDFARDGLDLDLPDISLELGGGKVPVSTFISNISAVRASAQDEEGRAKVMAALEKANLQMGLYLNTARLFGFTPPEDPKVETWLRPSELMESGIINGGNGADYVEFEARWLGLLEELGGAEPNSEAFKTALQNLATAVDEAIEDRARERKRRGEDRERGELSTIGPELVLYKGKFTANVQAFLIIGFLLMCGSLLAPSSTAGTWLRKGGVSFGVIALALMTVWLTLRCIVMRRAPVANLYETVIFIVAIILLLAVIFHFATRRPIVLPAALFASIIGIFISMLYDRMKGEDTMDPLVAVLNSNFWLSTHVTTVTMGYAAGLLGAVISHVFIFAKLFGVRDKAFFRDATRMVYAIICFTLVFSLVGTILGGIWANVSWGRFWGWDPKENGALLIVLVTLAILHARLGGYIKLDGLHFASIGLGMVVAFSWWYVNVMGVGLHSYGFTSGIKKAVWIFWGIEIAVLIAGVIAWLIAKEASRPAPPRESKAGHTPGSAEPAA